MVLEPAGDTKAEVGMACLGIISVRYRVHNNRPCPYHLSYDH